MIKAISLHQPFASLIASGLKTLETRRWSTNYRGRLLICSTQKPKIDGMPLGQALCVVSVTGCRPMVKADETAACCEWYKGAFAWELKHITPIVPFAVKGGQGFFNVDRLDVDYEYLERVAILEVENPLMNISHVRNKAAKCIREQFDEMKKGK